MVCDDLAEYLILDDLEKVNGSLQLYYMNQVSSFMLPSLLEVNGNFNLSNNSSMEHFEAPLFHDLTGSLTIRDNTDLQTVDLSSLECIEDFTVVGNNMTPEVLHALLLQLSCSRARHTALVVVRDGPGSSGSDLCSAADARSAAKELKRHC